MASVNYPDSVQFLYALGNEIKTAKLGLERIAQVLDALGRPQDRTRFVHVAGTNGKGSTCAMIASALRARGAAYRTLHLAPPDRAHRAHPDRWPADFRRALRRRLRTRACRRGATAGRRRNRPAHHLLRNRDRHGSAGLRRGSGGHRGARGGAGRTPGCHQRRDAGAVRDHAHRFRPRGFSGPQPGSHRGREGGDSQGRRAGGLCPPAQRSGRRARPARRATLHSGGAHGGVDASTTWRSTRAAADFCSAANSILRIVCPLAGEHQVENAATAAVALTRLGVSEPEISAGIAQTRWPGRLERVSEASRDHPGWRAQSRRGARAGRIHRALLCAAGASA